MSISNIDFTLSSRWATGEVYEVILESDRLIRELIIEYSKPDTKFGRFSMRAAQSV